MNSNPVSLTPSTPPSPVRPRTAMEARPAKSWAELEPFVGEERQSRLLLSATLLHAERHYSIEDAVRTAFQLESAILEKLAQ
jgi:hypothetical protein